MKIQTACKFCRNALELEIDDDYAALRDPFGLIKFAACNHCADLKINQRKIFEKLRSACVSLQINFKESERTKIYDQLCLLTKAYLRVACEWVRTPQLQWQPEIALEILEHPDRLGKTLRKLWETVKWSKHQQPMI